MKVTWVKSWQVGAEKLAGWSKWFAFDYVPKEGCCVAQMKT